MRVISALQNPIETGVLATGQQSGSESAFWAAAEVTSPAAIGYGRDPVFVDCDVVEIAQAILHVFEGREELRAPPRRLLAGEEVGEEFRGVTHLLRLDAELVAASRIEPGELLDLLADLAEAPRQLLGGGGLDRDVAYRGRDRLAVSSIVRTPAKRRSRASGHETAASEPRPGRAPAPPRVAA